MKSIALKIERPSAERFSPYGELILPFDRKPDYVCPEFDWREKLAVLPLGEMAEVGVVEAKNTGLYRQRTLEQHCSTVEAILPVSKDVFLVLAKPEAFDKSETDPGDFAAFYVPAGAIAVLHAGVWHQGPMSLADRAWAYVLYRRDTGSNDKKVLDMEEQGIFLTVEAL